MSASAYTLAKMSTNCWTSPMASNSGIPANLLAERPFSYASGLVVEATTLEQLGTLLRAHLDVSRREQKHLVGDALHAAVERVRETAREVDQALRELRVRTLEIQDHRNSLLEAVRDLLGVVEAARQHQVNADRVRIRHRLDVRAGLPLCTRGPHARAERLLAGLGLGPVLELLRAAPRCQPADVRPLAIALLERLLGGVELLVSVVLVVLLGNPEVDERAAPEVPQAHAAES